jgi:O-antigen/teichoic acid export membrane protein
MPPEAAVEGARPADGPRRSVTRNAITLLGSQSFTWVLATVMLSLQPRFLGPVRSGQLRIAGSVWAMVAVLAAFGTTTFVTVEVAKHREIALALTRSTNRLRVFAFLALCPFVAGFMFVAGYDGSTVIVIALSAIAALVGLLAAGNSAALMGLQEMGQTARVEIITKTLVTALTAAVLILGGRVYPLITLWSVIAVFSWWISARALRGVAPGDQAPTPLVGRVLVRATLPFLLAEATLVIYQQVDTVIMSLLVGEKQIGWYGAADILFGSLLFAPVILMTSLFPAMADKFEHAPDEVDTMMRRTFQSLLLIAVPIGLGTIIVSHSFVPLLYGDDFAPAAQVLQIYGVVTVLSCITILLGRFALATGRVKFWTVLMIVATLVSIPLDIVTVPWAEDHYGNGAMGGAMSYVVTESLMLTVGVIKIAPGLIDRKVLTRLARCAIAGLAMFLVGWPLRDRFFLVPGGLAVLVYLVIIVALRTFNADERELLGRAVRKVPVLRRLGKA